MVKTISRVVKRLTFLIALIAEINSFQSRVNRVLMHIFCFYIYYLFGFHFFFSTIIGE